MQSEDSKKAQAREAFNQFATQLHERQLGQLTNDQLHEGLARFYISEIYNKLNSPIDDEDFEEGWVNAGNDLGVDFIHKNDQTVLILQSKFKGQKSSVDQREILHFQTIFNRLVKRDFKKYARLSDAVADMDPIRMSPKRGSLRS